MEKRNFGNKRWKIWLAALVGIIAMLSVICIIYVNDYYRADEAAKQALLSDEAVKVEWIEDNVIAFVPEDAIAGLIFYPGGKVEYTAYAPLLHGLAKEGVFCVLCKMPCNLAVLAPNAAEGLQENFSGIENWYIGGHSLGGSMAAVHVAEHADDYNGLILLAAYSTKDISSLGLQALSVYGTEDGVLNMEKYENSLTNLPADRKECIIEAGCHAQFGSYGKQDRDGTPRISGEEQRQITIEAIMELIGE